MAELHWPENGHVEASLSTSHTILFSSGGECGFISLHDLSLLPVKRLSLERVQAGWLASRLNSTIPIQLEDSCFLLGVVALTFWSLWRNIL